MTSQQAINRSVQNGNQNQMYQPLDTLVFSMATVADSIIPWGKDPVIRDKQLREFWPTEPILASALYNISGRDAAFSWTLDGPPRTVANVQRILHEADFGAGWLSFVMKIRQDILTQDNGAFIEIIRASDSPTAPVVGIAHLDAARCRRTRSHDTPVLYTDDRGRQHALKWYQVIRWSEFPSSVSTMNGMQYCAVTRCLRAAQLLRDVSIYNREKIGGNTPDAIHLIGGVQNQKIEDAISSHQELQMQQGYVRYVKPILIASLDPTAQVAHEEIRLKSLPDGFKLEEWMRWYINQLALAFGADYQDFAPLPGRSLGSGAQSTILHMKSRGKGPELFMKGLEHQFNFFGVMPTNVTFMFAEQDFAQDQEQAELEEIKGRTRTGYITAGVLTPRAVQQQMLDAGEISQEEFDALQMESATPGDVTPDVTAYDDEPVGQRQRREATDERPPFLEDERLETEDLLEAAVLDVFTRRLQEIRQHITPSKGFMGRRKQGDDPAEVFADEAAWERTRAEMLRAVEPVARNAAMEAARGVALLGFGVDMDDVDQGIVDFTRGYVNDWYEELDLVTRRQLQNALVTWQETGLGDRGIPDLIKAIEPTFGRERASRIAVTEVTRMFDLGGNLANISAGITTEEWHTSADERVCPICAPLDKQRYGVTEGPRPVSDTHVRCRCQRLPVGFDEE